MSSYIANLGQIRTSLNNIKTSLESKGVEVSDDLNITDVSTYVDSVDDGKATIKGLILRDVTSLVIPDGVTKIGSSAFYCNTKLNYVTIPNSVTSIETSAFSNCMYLISVVIPDTVTTLGNSAFYYCTNLRTAIIGNGVTSIGSSTFASCKLLDSVTIGNSVKGISSNAFNQCKFTSVILPESVTGIASSAFINCTSLASVTVLATTPPTLGSSDAFNYNASGRVFYVPDDSVDAYKAATNWSKFADYIKPLSEKA